MDNSRLISALKKEYSLVLARVDQLEKEYNMHLRRAYVASQEISECKAQLADYDAAVNALEKTEVTE